jgi:hypothetical protein
MPFRILAALLSCFLVQASTPPTDTGRDLERLRRENFPLVDYHTHLKEGLTLEDVVRRWREHGIRAGVAVNGGLSFPVSNDAALEPFLAQLKGQPVYAAFQAEGREWVTLFSRQALARFDYVFTDAMTWTDDAGKRMRLWIDNEVGTIADPQTFMSTLVDRTVAILNDEPIDLHVNPTFLPSQLSARYDELWTAARVERVLSALKANGIGMEINNRYRIPSVAIVKRARAAGIKLACGTNNAGPQDLGRMEYCIQVIRECGLTPADMWQPPVEGKKAVQRKRMPTRS